MASLYAMKPRFQALLRPLAQALARAGVSPNTITLATLAVCAGYGALLAGSGSRSAFVFLPAVLLARMAGNALDGMLAREHGGATLLGARLNELADVASDICLYLPFVLVVAPASLVVAVVLAGVLAEHAGVLAGAHGGARGYAGPFGKADRAAFFAVMALVIPLARPPGAVVGAFFVLAAGAGLLTAWNRLRCAAPCQS
jgi:CDP-diacylglycerol---glycerol-3-phosphate 3-phosphatidyltransferase